MTGLVSGSMVSFHSTIWCVPAGTHTLVLWNKTIEPETRQVTVPDGGEVEVNLTVAAPPAPK